MNITLSTLDQEQQTALTQLCANHASPEAWGSAVLLGLIDEQVIRNIDAKGLEMLAYAKTLPPAKRLDFTSQATELLVSIATS
jgi:hypothetical protein